MFGTYFAGQMIKRGRRWVMFISAGIGIVGVGITVWQNYAAIICGRLLYGVSVGLLAIAMPRIMEETVPLEWVGFFGGCYCLSFAFATLIAYAMAVFLPPEHAPEAMANSPVV